VFQLHPNAWRFAGGHVPKLELLGRSPGYLRPSNGIFTVTVSSLELRLPVREAPSGDVLETPATSVLPLPESEPLGCDAAPRTVCHGISSGDASLAVTTPLRGPARFDFRFRSRGTADPAGLGDPTATTTFRVCVYDAAGTLVESALAPAGTRCGAGPCWRRSERGVRYVDADAATGVRRLSVATGGHSTVLVVSGRGPHLGEPALPLLVGPVTVQLHGEGPEGCWGNTFLKPSRNTARALRAGVRR
jgi:hypothetical protein